MNHEELALLGLNEEQIAKISILHNAVLEGYIPKADYENQVQSFNRLKMVSALDKALITAGAKNPAAVRGLLNFDSLTLNEDGSVVGLQEQLSGLKTSDSYLFKETGLKNLGSMGSFSRNPYSGQVNPWAKDSFNLTLQAKILKENPDMAQKLMALAGVR